MKTHHLANVILMLVMLAAVIGMYSVLKGPGMAVQMSNTEVDSVGQCCCVNHGGTPFMKPSLKAMSMTLPSDCTAVCQQSEAQIC